jgi:ABC-type nitrate/sulfonate/bicarbonate transport system substrate-binding protein
MAAHLLECALRRTRLLALGCVVLFAFIVELAKVPTTKADNSSTGGVVNLSVGTTGMTAAIWPLMAGVKKGLFQHHRVNLDIVQIQNASVNVQDMMTGALQFVSAGADAAILPIAHGAKLAVIGGIENVFVGRLIAGKEISSMQDLRGKVLSVSRRNGPDAAAITEMLASAGVDADPASFSIAGGSATRLAAVINGGAAATLLVPPEDFRAVKMGLKDLGLNVGKSKPLQFNVLFIDRNWGEANRPVVVNTLLGLIDACTWLNNPTNREEASQILADYTRIDPELAKRAYDVLVTDTHSFPRAGELDIEGFSNVLGMLATFGMIDKPLPTPTKFIDDSYLKQAMSH